jgi:hypothetical protein
MTPPEEIPEEIENPILCDPSTATCPVCDAIDVKIVDVKFLDAYEPTYQCLSCDAAWVNNSQLHVAIQG